MRGAFFRANVWIKTRRRSPVESPRGRSITQHLSQIHLRSGRRAYAQYARVWFTGARWPWQWVGALRGNGRVWPVLAWQCGAIWSLRPLAGCATPPRPPQPLTRRRRRWFERWRRRVPIEQSFSRRRACCQFSLAGGCGCYGRRPGTERQEVLYIGGVGRNGATIRAKVLRGWKPESKRVKRSRHFVTTRV